MTKIERVELLSSKKDFFYLFALFTFLLIFSLAKEYYNYKELTKFDSQLVHAKVLKQYQKKNHQVLKLKSNDGSIFYSITSKKTPNYKDKNIELEVWAGKINFLSYLKGFFAFSKIIKVDTHSTYKEKISHSLSKVHADKVSDRIYQALYLAKPLPYQLQQKFSNLGVSHLLAISGFHLGVLSTLLFFIIKYPYTLLQNNFFPYRNAKRDIFFIISTILLFYMFFLDSPPSLLRSYAMLIVGFILYDKGVKIISIQTLLISILLLLALFPRLIFSIGFFLSISGVFYIFLFLIYFEKKSKVWQFLLLPFWVYLMMLPYSLTLFGNFSLYHPLSILFTSLFTLFYPLSIFLHFIGFGDSLDSILQILVQLDTQAVKISLSKSILYIEILLSLLALYKKEALVTLLIYNFSIFIYSIYYIA